MFDKTGTLTLGEHRVVDIATVREVGSAEALRLAAAVERDSEHPIGRAIIKSAVERGLDVPRAEGFRSLGGKGVKATVDGRELAVGGPKLLQELAGESENPFVEDALRASAKGQSTIYLVDGSRVIAAFAVADAIRPESREAVQRFSAARTYQPDDQRRGEHQQHAPDGNTEAVPEYPGRRDTRTHEGSTERVRAPCPLISASPCGFNARTSML